jgi:hypothetical protein
MMMNLAMTEEKKSTRLFMISTQINVKDSFQCYQRIDSHLCTDIK